MNPGPLLFLGTFFVMATSWLGFVLVPQLQLGRQPQVVVAETGQPYPAMRPGLARQGEQVYRANGCFYCHSEQVRPRGYGSDVDRLWGGRKAEVQSVAQDYLYDQPVMLGSQRVGPDLANIGLRQTNEIAIWMHLYDPKTTMPGSVMPPYRYLFTKRPIRRNATAATDALPLDEKYVPDGYEIVPTDDARALAAYLMSLRSEAALFEAPPPPPSPAQKAAAAAAAATNAPAAAAAGTNSPAK